MITLTKKAAIPAAALLFGCTGMSLLAQQLPVVMPVPAILQNYKPVTNERLLKPEDENVLMVRRTYDGWGYSPLKQITPSNVAKLQPVWSFATGSTSGHEATPLVNNGVMFVATPGNQVLAIDAKSGTVLWRYLNRRRKSSSCIAPAAASPSMATRCSSPGRKPCSSRSMRRRARKSGRR
jgi:alcohol dehydrogenase (cytochrome c)